MKKKPPNIVFITTDTQGQNMVSAYGNRAGVETPNIDRFANDAVLFENSFCASPLCTPARSAWFSGLHPNRNGAWTNDTTMRRGVPLLAEVLGGTGYRCIHLGKWHLDAAGYNGAGKADGGFCPPWYDITNFHQEHPQDGPNRFGAWNRGLDDIEYCFGHCVADKAIEVMQNAGDSPLFLAVEFDEPHGPYICPPPFRGRFGYDELYRPDTLNADMTGKPEIQKQAAEFLRAGRNNPEDLPAYYRLYHDCNSYVDHEIGRVLDAINQHLPEDTIVVYTSDHGDHHGAFGQCAKGPTMYDATCAVPLLIRAPDCARGVRTQALASGVDILPTLLDLSGVEFEMPAKHGYSGVSLAPVLRQQAESVRDYVAMEYNRFGIAMRQDEGFFPIRCIRTANWKLAINLFDRDELYHLAEDPNERENLIDNQPCCELRNELHDQVLAWQDGTRDPFRGPQWKLRNWRQNATHQFEGLFTTGYKDEWDNHDFHRPKD